MTGSTIRSKSVPSLLPFLSAVILAACFGLASPGAVHAQDLHDWQSEQPEVVDVDNGIGLILDTRRIALSDIPHQLSIGVMVIVDNLSEARILFDRRPRLYDRLYGLIPEIASHELATSDDLMMLRGKIFDMVVEAVPSVEVKEILFTELLLY